ncbi:hypothetical protein [Francisella frigiditurris]|uniref:Uncharacterized protein n=1 Tax=Francisella frigiditurris TaxID=1542390 RepID=A0A1J0KUX1_9GAMM|nr:hypothetical protein [Francisella frigiditurris]APC97412.1 hypothetical protein KX01_929 [Francisella frigiditurris]
MWLNPILAHMNNDFYFYKYLEMKNVSLYICHDGKQPKIMQNFNIMHGQIEQYQKLLKNDIKILKDSPYSYASHSESVIIAIHKDSQKESGYLLGKLTFKANEVLFLESCSSIDKRNREKYNFEPFANHIGSILLTAYSMLIVKHHDHFMLKATFAAAPFYERIGMREGMGLRFIADQLPTPSFDIYARYVDNIHKKEDEYIHKYGEINSDKFYKSILSIQRNFRSVNKDRIFKTEHLQVSHAKKYIIQQELYAFMNRAKNNISFLTFNSNYKERILESIAVSILELKNLDNHKWQLEISNQTMKYLKYLAVIRKQTFNSSVNINNIQVPQSISKLFTSSMLLDKPCYIFEEIPSIRNIMKKLRQIKEKYKEERIRYIKYIEYVFGNDIHDHLYILYKSEPVFE